MYLCIYKEYILCEEMALHRSKVLRKNEDVSKQIPMILGVLDWY